MYVNVWKFLSFCALIVLVACLFLPREPEVLFGGSMVLIGLAVALTQMEDKN